MNTQKARTCYLAASASTELQTIEQLLVERGFQPIVSADLLSTALTFLEGTVNAISTADLFIAVLSSDENNDNVYIELGIAIAKECRILIVAPPSISMMVNIAELPTIRVDASNNEAIGFMLDQILTAPLRKFRPQLPVSVPQGGHAIGDFADELEKDLATLGEKAPEVAITQLVMLALEKSGYSIVANSPVIGQGKNVGHPDLVVWSDEFGPWIGNPLIIEVKTYFG